MNLERIEPLAKLGIKLVGSHDGRTQFRIPLNGNKNDKGTLFAGSQYSALVVAGWYHTAQWGAEQRISEQVAIKDCNIKFPKPAQSDLLVEAWFEQQPDRRLSGHWRAQVMVEGKDSSGDVVARLTGDYRLMITRPEGQ